MYDCVCIYVTYRIKYVLIVQVIDRYCGYIEDQEERLHIAKKYNCHNTAIDVSMVYFFICIRINIDTCSTVFPKRGFLLSTKISTYIWWETIPRVFIDNMALWTHLQRTDWEAFFLWDINLVATNGLKPSIMHFFDLYPVNTRAVSLNWQQKL